MSKPIDTLKLRPRHKWFSASSRDEEGWDGPHKTFERAALATFADAGNEGQAFVTQGYKMTKREREEWGVDFEWQCDTANAIEVRLKT